MLPVGVRFEVRRRCGRAQDRGGHLRVDCLGERRRPARAPAQMGVIVASTIVAGLGSSVVDDGRGCCRDGARVSPWRPNRSGLSRRGQLVAEDDAGLGGVLGAVWVMGTGAVGLGVVAVVTQHLEARRKALPSQPDVEAGAADAGRTAVAVSAAVDVVDGQKRRLGLPAARARSAVGAEHLAAQGLAQAHGALGGLAVPTGSTHPRHAAPGKEEERARAAAVQTKALSLGQFGAAGARHAVVVQAAQAVRKLGAFTVRDVAGRSRVPVPDTLRHPVAHE